MQQQSAQILIQEQFRQGNPSAKVIANCRRLGFLENQRNASSINRRKRANTDGMDVLFRLGVRHKVLTRQPPVYFFRIAGSNTIHWALC